LTDPVIFDCVKLGEDVVIGEGSIIGGLPTTFGKREGRFVRNSSDYGVAIGSNVDIGYNTVILRGTKSDTTIEDNVVISHACTIGHDSQISSGVLIGCNSVILGHVNIERDTEICPNVCIRNRVTIGEGSYIGMGSLVTKDVPPNSFGYGRPFKVIQNKEEPGYKIYKTRKKIQNIIKKFR
jgi:UDP-3-O-[3-hydroxymyristoyl] glucosamine N-acyltransferase